MSKDTDITLEVPVVRGADGSIDLNTFVENARKLGTEYAENDAAQNKAIVDATNTVLSNPKFESKHFTASTLARMAVGVLGVMPSDKICKDAEERVKALLNGREEFLHLSAGRLSGYHVKSRYTAEELAKLSPKKTA